jgi:hypothetical protein
MSTPELRSAKYVTTKAIPLDHLEHFPGNANTGDVDKILESLRVNGQFRSLIIRHVEKRYVIMAGNHTAKALRKHGIGKCAYEIKHENDPAREPACGICHNGWDGRPRCEIYTCDDQTAIRINIADNRIPEFSKRDDEMLAALLGELDDLSGSGFTDEEASLVAGIGAEVMPEPGDADIEDLPPVFGVVVDCTGEDEQISLLERLSSEGYSVRSLMS